MDKCNHDISAPDNSVSLFPRRNMALPCTIYGRCVVCHKSLTFIQEQNSKEYVLKEAEDEDS